MKYRARSRNIYYPTDDAMTLDQVLSMFEKVDEPEEIEEISHLPPHGVIRPEIYDHMIDMDDKINELILDHNTLKREVNALRRKE